jgi:hypothetical protein
MQLYERKRSAYTPFTERLKRGEVMQMMTFLSLLQVLISFATLVVAILALKQGDPPENGGSSTNKSEK